MPQGDEGQPYPADFDSRTGHRVREPVQRSRNAQERRVSSSSLASHVPRRNVTRGCRNTILLQTAPFEAGDRVYAPHALFLIQATALAVLSSSYSIGIRMPRLEWRGRRLWKI